MRLRFVQSLAVMVALVAPAAASGRAGSQGDMKIPRGSRVEIDNPNGDITVTGTDSDVLHVSGRYDSGNAATIDVANAGAAGSIEIRPSHRGGEGGTVNLVVELPHDVALPSVSASSGNVVITKISGDVRVECSSGNARVSGVGSAYVRAGSGDVVVEDSAGGAYVEASSGDVIARNIKGDLKMKLGSGNATVDGANGIADIALASGDLDLRRSTGAVRVDAISGDITIAGAGSVQARSASGNVSASDVAGDFEVQAASGNIEFVGSISPDHTYRLRSLSGDAIMRLCGDVPGFTIRLRSYSGDIETEFPLKVDSPALISRGLTGRFGDGRTDIQIEATSGSAKILACTRDSGGKKK